MGYGSYCGIKKISGEWLPISLWAVNTKYENSVFLGATNIFKEYEQFCWFYKTISIYSGKN